MREKLVVRILMHALHAPERLLPGGDPMRDETKVELRPSEMVVTGWYDDGRLRGEPACEPHVGVLTSHGRILLRSTARSNEPWTEFGDASLFPEPTS